MVLRQSTSRLIAATLPRSSRILGKDALRLSLTERIPLCRRRICTVRTSGSQRHGFENQTIRQSRLRPLTPHIFNHRTQSSNPTVRSFSTSPSHHHGDLTPPKPGEERHITFIEKDGTPTTFTVADGDNLLDIAQANDLEMEGACGGSCACSTCHVIVKDDEFYDKMEEPSDDENDMLDLAFGLTETSRLGCQVQMSKDLDGIVVRASLV